MSFTMTTDDSVHTYTSNNEYGEPVYRWEVQNNNRTSNTMGFLRKVEKGSTRVKSVVNISDSKSNIEDNILPMLTYPDNVNVKFGRNIPTKATTTDQFTFENYKIFREFDGGDSLEIEITLTEVLP